MKYTTNDIKKLGTILGIWAHPDDEAWSMAGIMVSAVMNGQRVVLVTATPGDAGETSDESKWPKSNLGEIRKAELAESLKIMGVTEHYWLDYKDGTLAQAESTEAVSQIKSIIDHVKPDSLFTFGADGITGHEDHKTVRRWTVEANNRKLPIYQATEATEKFDAISAECHKLLNIYFNIDHPDTKPIANMDLCFTLTPELLEIKLVALRAQASQTAKMFNSDIGCDFIEKQAATECFMLYR
jgi:LmbE family N-acetylglucosaminyl deacetylase